MKRLNMLCLLVILCGCSGAPTVSTFENSNIFISYPAGWDVVEEEEIGDKGYFLEIEKESVSGTKLIVGWIEDVEIDALLSSVQVGLESKMSYVNSNLTFVPPIKCNAPNEDCFYQSFYFEQLGEPFHGLIYCKRQNVKSIVIIKQEALVDKNVNAPDFELMEKSLLIY